MDQDASSSEYVVVARRYRPQSFEQLVGQHQVALALSNAINTHRVGHAYLFTGARGVGKTSTARIFAKALNCQEGPTPAPCNVCDICVSISAGDDVDVLEIDGASNRGIDEIRQLRSNVNIRPSRARSKIYIIDEVHMLTTAAFNALLKTLEEPPEHVKFIFCTTDPEKIPITVLSRCQRFDFQSVETGAIVERLQFIVESEGATADPEALALLARRACGSLRDSQSLLEQLLSFGDRKITLDDVHHMLGTAPSGRLGALVDRLLAREAAAALGEVDAAVAAGADLGQLIEQLLGYFRDIMAATVGCGPALMLHTSSQEYETLLHTGGRVGLESTLAIVQILDQTLARMRQSTHNRVLADAAVVRICHLPDLQQLAGLIGQLQAGNAPQPVPVTRNVEHRLEPAKAQQASQQPNDSPQKKSRDKGISDNLTETACPASGGRELSADSVDAIWSQALSELEDMTSELAAYCDRVAISAPNRLVVSFKSAYTLQKESCERPERKQRIEQALSRIAGREIRIDLEVLSDPDEPHVLRPPRRTARELRRDSEKNSMVRQAMELFDGELLRVEEGSARPTARQKG